MAGQAKPSRVGEPLSVYQDNIRCDLQLLQSIDCGGNLSKSEVARDVGDGGLCSAYPYLCHLQLRPPQHDDRPKHPTVGVRW